MTAVIDETHDPQLRSWVDSANDPASDFPIQNLPFGMFDTGSGPKLGVAIGDQILPVGNESRLEISRLLRAGARARPLVPMRDAQMIAVQPGDYTDFYASIYHATRVGKLFRPDNPLLPNYKHVPIAYHGRASTIRVSGTPVRRPCGQTGAGIFGPTKRLDYELELAVVIAKPNEEPIGIDSAEDHVLGVCLLNDWSARDIQAWEYQPLGPFLAKNFATSVSPWIVTMEALAPFRAPASEHDVDLLPYLTSTQNRQHGGIDIILEVLLKSARMPEPVRLSIGNFRDMYWTFAQMIAHHTSNGCVLRRNDLIASGTVSGPEPESAGCLLEHPITLPNGEQRTFLEDGDEVILRGWCQRPGFRRIGLGECRGLILPARESH
jgi:fumarylacetoacetase